MVHFVGFVAFFLGQITCCCVVSRYAVACCFTHHFLRPWPSCPMAEVEQSAPYGVWDRDVWQHSTLFLNLGRQNQMEVRMLHTHRQSGFSKLGDYAAMVETQISFNIDIQYVIIWNKSKSRSLHLYNSSYSTHLFKWFYLWGHGQARHRSSRSDWHAWNGPKQQTNKEYSHQNATQGNTYANMFVIYFISDTSYGLKLFQKLKIDDNRMT